jgi:TonB family protein
MWNKQRIIAMASQLLANVGKLSGMLLVPSRQAAGGVSSEYLGNQYFSRIIFLAVGLHALAIYAWHLSPKTHVVDIPVRVLNIKLGDMDSMAETQSAASEPNAANTNAVENTLSKLVKDVPTREDQIKPVEPKGDILAESKKAAKAEPSQDYLSKLTSPKQYVRANPSSAAQKITISDAKTNAEVMRRYEQLISLWIQKFKLYPEEARAQNMQGETVVRIRIDRQGNIIHRMLERSTGYQMLDRAALDMISRANPVPAVPHDYPQGDLMEFLIPVTFQLS